MNTAIAYRRQWVAGFLVSLLLVTASTCDQPKNLEWTASPDVDSLVNVFRVEALKRGIVVNTSRQNLVVGFGDLGSRSGSCKPNTKPKVVTLDSLIWKHTTVAVKEMLLAHELGHCLLGLEHNNTILGTGECASWMRENDDGCKINYVNKGWREYYLDALFSEGRTSAPSWCDPKRLPATAEKLMSTHVIRENGFEILDTGALRKIGKWKVIVKIPEGSHMGVVSFGINEYHCAFSFLDRTSILRDSLTETIMLYQYKTPELNILSNTTVSKYHACAKLVVEKTDDTIFVFFDDTLKLCIPLDNDTVKMTWYSTFETDQNKMEVYKVIDR